MKPEIELQINKIVEDIVLGNTHPITAKIEIKKLFDQRLPDDTGKVKSIKPEKINQFTRVGTWCNKCNNVMCVCEPEKKVDSFKTVEQIYRKHWDACMGEKAIKTCMEEYASQFKAPEKEKLGEEKILERAKRYCETSDLCNYDSFVGKKDVYNYMEEAYVQGAISNLDSSKEVGEQAVELPTLIEFESIGVKLTCNCPDEDDYLYISIEEKNNISSESSYLLDLDEAEELGIFLVNHAKNAKAQ